MKKEEKEKAPMSIVKTIRKIVRKARENKKYK